MNQILSLAGQLLQSGHKQAAGLLVRAFIQAVQAPNNHHLTPAAVQQLVDLAQKVVKALR